jgi:hypothetical protein
LRVIKDESRREGKKDKKTESQMRSGMPIILERKNSE